MRRGEGLAIQPPPQLALRNPGIRAMTGRQHRARRIVPGASATGTPRASVVGTHLEGMGLVFSSGCGRAQSPCGAVHQRSQARVKLVRAAPTVPDSVPVTVPDQQGSIALRSCRVAPEAGGHRRQSQHTSRGFAPRSACRNRPGLSQIKVCQPSFANFVKAGGARRGLRSAS
jgi:hypothetical protein